jgi:hypothetical protein
LGLRFAAVDRGETVARLGETLRVDRQTAGAAAGPQLLLLQNAHPLFLLRAHQAHLLHRLRAMMTVMMKNKMMRKRTTGMMRHGRNGMHSRKLFSA